jgi:hypothetical protein
MGPRASRPQRAEGAKSSQFKLLQARCLRSQLRRRKPALFADGGFESVHNEKTPRHLALRRLDLAGLFAERHGRVANRLVKQAAERSEALKSYFKANVGHPQFVSTQQFFGALNAPFDQVLVRGLVECLSKQPQKVITREAGVAGNLVEIERQVVAEIDKLAGAIQPLENVGSRRCCLHLSHFFAVVYPNVSMRVKLCPVLEWGDLSPLSGPRSVAASSDENERGGKPPRRKAVTGHRTPKWLRHWLASGISNACALNEVNEAIQFGERNLANAEQSQTLRRSR